MCPTLSASHYQLSEPIAVDRCRYLTGICCRCWPSQDFAGGDYSRAEQVSAINALAVLAELHPMSSINGDQLQRFSLIEPVRPPVSLPYIFMIMSINVVSKPELCWARRFTSHSPSLRCCKAAAVSLHPSVKEKHHCP